MPVGASKREVESLIVEDVDPAKTIPPAIDSFAPEPKNCRGMHIILDDPRRGSTLFVGSPIPNVSNI